MALKIELPGITNIEKFQLDDFFVPRPYQREVFKAIEGKYKKAILIWPRRAGKDITLWHIILRQALKRIGTYIYCLPTYSQCRAVIWTAITSPPDGNGIRFIDMIPPTLISKINNSEMSITLKNRSIIKLVGSNAYERSLVGSNPIGIIFSEFARADYEAYTFSLPIINANEGFIVINSTPFGKNHFYKLYNIAKSNPQSWFLQHLTVHDTKHISAEAIHNEILSGEMSSDKSKQEYECSFECGCSGAFFAKNINQMYLDGRIGDVPWESHLPVHSTWDIGVRDTCVIIFFQIVNSSIHIIDCFSKNKEGLEYYARYIHSQPYQYGKHIAPHDIKVQEFGSGLTRLEMAKDLGINFLVAPKIARIDGIEKVRATLSRIYIDQVKCKDLIIALENYQQEFDEKHHIYKLTPLHDRYSHFADALRYGCLCLNHLQPDTTPEELNKRYHKVMGRSSGSSQYWNPL